MRTMIENKEQYKKEYNDFFEYAFQRYTLAFFKPVLHESYHVAEGMEDAATEIGNIAKKFITETIFSSIQKYFSQYLSKVHDISAQKFPHLYNYKRVDEVFDCAGSLYPDEVILYPVV